MRERSLISFWTMKFYIRNFYFEYNNDKALIHLWHINSDYFSKEFPYFFLIYNKKFLLLLLKLFKFQNLFFKKDWSFCYFTILILNFQKSILEYYYLLLLSILWISLHLFKSIFLALKVTFIFILLKLVTFIFNLLNLIP